MKGQGGRYSGQSYRRGSGKNQEFDHDQQQNSKCADVAVRRLR